MDLKYTNTIQLLKIKITCLMSKLITIFAFSFV